MNAPDTIGERLQVFRKTLGLTQQSFADRLDTTQANISQIEKNVSVPTGNFFQELAMGFPQLDFNWLLYGKGPVLRSWDDPEMLKDEIGRYKKVIEEQALEIKALQQQMRELVQSNNTLISLLGKR